MCIKVARHSPQKALGMPDLFSMAVIFSLSDLFACSATPFCSGLFRVVCWRAIPHDVANWWNSFDMYLPPLSSCKVLMQCPDWFSAYSLKFLNACDTSDFLLTGNTNLYFESHLWRLPSICTLWMCCDQHHGRPSGQVREGLTCDYSKLERVVHASFWPGMVHRQGLVVFGIVEWCQLQFFLLLLHLSMCNGDVQTVCAIA